MKCFTVMILILLATVGGSSFSYAFETQPFLQIGAGAGYTKFQSRENESEYGSANLGIHSQFGYRYQLFEYGIFSNIYVGETEDINIVNDVDFVSGDGWVSGIDIGAYCKYFFPLDPVKGWRLYGFLGPALSLRTLRFTDYDTNVSLQGDYKITLNSYGVQFRLGVEQKDRKKKEKPIYIEFIYSYMETYKGSVVDVSNVRHQKTIATESLDDLEFYTHSFMVSVGFTLL